MDIIGSLIGALSSGWGSLIDYVSQHTLTCLVPALFIAGAIAVFVRKEAILKYFGPRVPRWKSYPLAAISGTVLAVCSCTILPLFAGIYRKGSGIGPATAFLYSGPAINILAIAYTASALGYGLGTARAIGSILMAMLIGLIMSILFKVHDDELAENANKAPMVLTPEGKPRPFWVHVTFFASLMGILIFGASSLGWIVKAPIVAGFLFVLGLISFRYYDKENIKDWTSETWDLTKKIVPILIAGAFVVGIIAYFLPPETFRPILGNEGITANLLASVIGALLYMPTLLEVPIIGTTFGYSSGLMGSGPALSLLLAGPAVSLPSIIVLYKIMGLKKTASYIVLVIMFSSAAGFVYGNLF